MSWPRRAKIRSYAIDLFVEGDAWIGTALVRGPPIRELSLPGRCPLGGLVWLDTREQLACKLEPFSWGELERLLEYLRRRSRHARQAYPVR
jgi:hypothetical protein